MSRLPHGESAKMTHGVGQVQQLSKDDHNQYTFERFEPHSSVRWRPIFRTLLTGGFVFTLAMSLGGFFFRSNSATTPKMAFPTSSSQTLFEDSQYYSPQQSKVQYEKCSSIVASMTRQFEFNVTITENPDARQWRFLESIAAESHENLRGEVSVNRGDIFQASDILVHVIIGSNHQSDLQNVLFDASVSALALDYIFTGAKDVCTDIQVLVFLRPQPVRLLDVLEIQCQVLDIWFKGSLAWEINTLVAHTWHEHTYQGSSSPDPLITHNVSVSSVSGNLFGYYLATGNLNVSNEKGPIGLLLVPGFEGALQPESITVTTLSGDIHVKALYEHWPSQPLAHITNIHTTDGEITADIPHGSFTNLSSDGGIITRLRPFGAASLDSRSELHTHSQSGLTHLYLTDADTDSLVGGYNPLLKMTSKHHVGNGRLEMKYPDSWFGNMKAQIEHGSLTFEAGVLEEIERGKGYVKAKKGKEGNSQMEARVVDGEMYILLGV
ncbi:hypothetical protein EJ02DRAFT_388081 [Clathrospora elynae]|uniref:Uncharacterized protein n=1 Tax=Clathrospora elynae TaxID=706981 RepID=A0A6A5S8D0_9PLEO|nr:hypothetical protein EJ02DRAFT_388081 [Clathrospora elynae]